MTQQREDNPQEPTHYPPNEDEIDLADLVGVLFRRKWTIVVTTVAVLLLAFIYTVIQTPVYNASSLVELGQVLTEDGYQKVESPNEARNRLTSLAQSVANDMNRASPKNETLQFSIENNFKVNAPDEGNIIALEVESPHDSKTLTFLDKTTQEFIADHNRILDQEKNQIETQIKTKKIAKENVNIQLAKLNNKMHQIKRDYSQDRTIKQNEINRLERNIENIQSEKNYFKQKISLLQEEKKSLQERIEQAQERYDQLFNSKLAANREATGANAVSMMLFSNEVNRIQDQIYQLRDRQLFKIPEQTNKLQTRLQEINSQIRNKRSEKELAVQELKQLEPERKEKIEEIQGDIKAKKRKKDKLQIDIDDLQNRLDNMITTQVIMEPRFADNPSSPNIKLNLALGLVLGVFIAVFFAFLREFWVRNKDKILQRDADTQKEK